MFIFLLFLTIEQLFNYVQPSVYQNDLHPILSEHLEQEVQSQGIYSKLYCNSRGKYTDGICNCFKGFVGEKCQFSDNGNFDLICKFRGTFNKEEYKCKCKAGYYGTYCEKVSCNGHGEFYNEKCYCLKTFTGENCEFKMDISSCNNRGIKLLYSNLTTVLTQKNYVFPDCLCNPGYNGKSCNLIDKSGDISQIFKFIKEFMFMNRQIGKINDQDTCNYGHTGPSCEFNSLSYECKNHGFYHKTTQKCYCFQNYMGHDCGIKRYSNYCNQKGYELVSNFVDRNCLCEEGVYGERCEFQFCNGNHESICQCTIKYGYNNCFVKSMDKQCNYLGVEYTDMNGEKKCMCAPNSNNCQIKDDSLQKFVLKQPFQDFNKTKLEQPKEQKNNSENQYKFQQLFASIQPKILESLQNPIDINSHQNESSIDQGASQILKFVENQNTNDVINFEMKKASDFLKQVQPKYKGVLSEYLDFFNSTVPINSQEAIEKYNDMVAKAQSLDYECNFHGHRLHFVQVLDSIIDKERNNSREEIIQLGDIKFSLYINDNTTVDSLLHTLGESKYEKIYCQCQLEWTGAYCEIPIIFKQNDDVLKSRFYNENERKILEQEEDRAVRNFQKFNEITLDLDSSEKIQSRNDQIRFLGVANDETKQLEKEELKLRKSSNKQKNKKIESRISLLQQIFGR